jgi:hypothetical protein
MSTLEDFPAHKGAKLKKYMMHKTCSKKHENFHKESWHFLWSIQIKCKCKVEVRTVKQDPSINEDKGKLHNGKYKLNLPVLA